MLKTRIIPTLLARGRELVKGEGFDSWRRVGNTLQAARVHNLRQVDEMCVLSLSGMFDLEDVKALCADTFMPVSIGGGVRSLEDFGSLLASGADKVVINTAALETPTLISRAASKFGNQAVVVSIDVRDGKVWTHNGTHKTGWQAVAWAKEAEAIGTGEILLGSIERDGTMRGYDLDTISEVASAVGIPVVASGGCGTFAHMAEALDAGAHAVAAGAMFLFADATPQGAAQYLNARGYHTRCLAA